jgi:hypothetical protein
MPNDEEVGGDGTDESWLVQLLRPSRSTRTRSFGGRGELRSRRISSVPTALVVPDRAQHDGEATGMGLVLPAIAHDLGQRGR